MLKLIVVIYIIKFNNPQVLFAQGSDVVNANFQEILQEFFPKYLGIVLRRKV